MKALDKKFIQLCKETSSRLTGSDRRAFQARVTTDYLDGSARRAESLFGWGRATVALGLKELESGYICYVELHERGNKKTEEKLPTLEEAIGELVDPQSQVDPKFQTPFAYTRITAKAVREALIEYKGYSDEHLPTIRTISEILNRLGYKLKRVQKAKPVKKVQETDAIFDNVHQVNRAADEDPEALRISMDTKAKVNIGEFSRGGEARDKEAPQASDNDMNPEEKLVPCGVLEVQAGQLTAVVGNSAETSDFKR